MWKTHKDYTTIPPTRPVCDASQGPLARSSNLITTILTPIMESRMFLEECDSTEDMLAAVDKANQTLRDNPPSTGEVSIISMDAEALYPSLALKDILDSIWTLVTTSDLQFKNINTKELGKYLAVMVDEDILKKHKVISSIPRRQAVIEGRGRRKPMLAFLDKSTYTKTINGEKVKEVKTSVSTDEEEDDCLGNHGDCKDNPHQPPLHLQWYIVQADFWRTNW